MARKQKRRPSFFTVLINDDYNSKLPIPTAFVKKYKFILPENVKLRSSNGEIWDVKIEDKCFTNGWDKFAEDAGMKMKEFLVFWFNIKNSIFDVSVFGSRGLKRDLSVKNLLLIDYVDNAPGLYLDITKAPNKIRLNNPNFFQYSRKFKKMNGSPENEAAFFQILINKDFDLSLRLPRDFVKKYGEDLPERAKLRICGTGKTWDVKLKLIDDDLYFTKGWKKFALDLDLERSEFLMFTFSSDESTFDVSVYGTDGCERKPPSDRYSCSSDDSDEVIEYLSRKKNKRSFYSCSSDDSDEVIEYLGHKKHKLQSSTHDDNKTTNSNPKYEIVLKEHQKSRVTIRKNFAEAAGLIGKEKVTVEYEGGSRTDVVLDLRSDSRLDLATGWNDFRKKNRLTFGRSYSFEFIPSEQVIQVKKIKQIK